MNKHPLLGLLTAALLILLTVPDLVSSEAPTETRPLKRAESFLGLHFDFHAGEDSTEVGRDLTPEMVESVLTRVRPDYIQVDSKGHPGFSSYPTQVGNPAPGFVRDPLKIFREVTARHGVALYVHHSGVWDAEAVRRNPAWARVNEKGEADGRLASVFGPYVDQLLIPQLKELRDVYKVDGVWVDGECWATERDYQSGVIEKFKSRTGLTEIPKEPDDPNWQEFSEFCRDGFRQYLKHYVDALHDHDRDFQIASNWAYSSMMPEPVGIDVDFISGDFSARDALNSARLEGRSMVHQGKPWDLMAWSFTWTDGLYSTKSVVQLQQEAAVVLALGGGFQAYFPQKRDGSIRSWQIDLMERVAEFCRERQAVCHRAGPVPQVGLIYSGEAFYRMNRKLFAGWHGELVPLQGVLRSLLEAQNVVDVVMEHHLDGRIDAYPLLVFPEWPTIEPDFKRTLLDYVRRGGSLLIIGPRAARLFEKELGVKLIGEPEELVNGLRHEGQMAGVKSLFQEARLEQGTERFGTVYNRAPVSVNDPVGPGFAAASIRAFGKGKIAAAYLNLGERYVNGRTTVSRDFLHGLVRTLFPKPLATVTGSHQVDVTINRIDRGLVVNLVNTSGPHADQKTHVFDEVPPIGPLEIRIGAEARPGKVSAVPSGTALRWRFDDGQVVVDLPRLEIHQAILVE
jgi:hypothetical protein